MKGINTEHLNDNSLFFFYEQEILIKVLLLPETWFTILLIKVEENMTKMSLQESDNEIPRKNYNQ